LLENILLILTKHFTVQRFNFMFNIIPIRIQYLKLRFSFLAVNISMAFPVTFSDTQST